MNPELRLQGSTVNYKVDERRQYRIVLADDHEKFREWLKSNLADRSELKIVGEVEDGYALLGLLSAGSRPDMVIMDISMPKLNGLEASKEIKRLYPGMKILVLTAHSEKEYFDRALAAGADGYLLKERATDLSDAISIIRKGGVYRSLRTAARDMETWVWEALPAED